MKKILFLLVLFFPLVSYMAPDICIQDKCLWKELYKWISEPLKWENGSAKAITKKDIVLNFCKSIYSFPSLPEKKWNSYKAKDSVFLVLLCTSVWDSWHETELKLKDSKLNYFKDFPNKAKKKSGPCIKSDWIITDPDAMDNVDFSCLAKKAFNMIASDMVNMWSFISYWWYESEEKRMQWEKDFFAGKNSPCPDSFLHSLKHKEEWYCQHPETLKQVNEQNKQLLNIIKNLKIVDIKPDEIYDKFSVWESKKKGLWTLLWILDKSYNELYFYGLFTSYYANSVKIFNTSVALKKSTSNMQELIDLNGEWEILNANKNIETAKKSLIKSFDTIKNIYRAYPIHIWYLALMEDFVRLRRSVAKIYTPVDQLRYKLEQAQEEEMDN